MRGLDAEQHLDDPRRRQRYVTAVFDLIAPRYDAFTRQFSFGMDRAWKRRVVELARAAAAAPRDSIVVVDLACGTGDLAFALTAERRRVVGVDASQEMLARASLRASDAAVRPYFAAGDMVELPLPDRSVDVVTIGYGLRNASRLDRTLDEIARVMRPGGHVVTLDFFRPENRLWRRLFLGYLSVAGNLVGWFWHGEPAAYGYIARSIERFVTADALSRELVARGFEVYHVEQKLLGGICVHAARWPNVCPP